MSLSLLRTLIGAFLLGHLWTGAAAQIRLDDPIPLSKDLVYGQLPNGLRYYIQQNGKPAKQVEMRLVVKAGSVLEDDDQRGLAHFVEHMAFNGSTHFKSNELVSYLQSIGMQFGADLNAYTSFDETVYILSVPTEKREHLEKAFLVLQDWAGGLAFNPAEVDKERGVVLEESRRGKGAGDRMGKQTLPKVFAGSKYAERLPIGKEETIRSFPVAAAKRFYQDWYRPNLMAVVIVGDIDPEDARNLVTAHFSQLKNPSKERPRPTEKIPARTVEESVVVTDKEATNDVVTLSYSRQAERAEASYRGYRERRVQGLLNTMLGQRLQALTQVPNPPFIGGNSSLHTLVQGVQEFSSGALVGKAGPQAALHALVQENARVLQYGFTADELDRAKKNFVRGLERAFNERAKTESRVFAAEFIRNFLVNESIPGIENELRFGQEIVAGIQLQDVTDLARSVITPAKNKLLIFQGTEANKPDGDDLLKAVHAAASAPVEAFVEKKLASTLMTQLPTPGSIVSEKTDVALGTTTLVFGNGATVTVKPTDFKSDQVLFSARRDGGQWLFPVADRANTRVATTVVGQMGIADFSPLDLQKMFAGKSVSLSPFISATAEGLSGGSGSAELELLLQLSHLTFTQPRKDPALYQSWLGRTQDALKNLQQNPEVRFKDAKLRAQYGDNPWLELTPTVQDLEAVSMERALSAYQARFASVKGFHFYLVGSFDVAQVKPLLARYLGSLPGTETEAKVKDVGIRPVKGVVRFEHKGGTEPKSQLSITITGEHPFSTADSLHLNVMVDTLEIKLVEVVRETLSASYSPQLSGGLSKKPYGHYTITFSTPCAPENVERITKAFWAEVERIKANGPTEADLGKVREHWFKNYHEGLKTNGFWLNQLRSADDLGEDPHRVFTYEARVNALTTKDLQEAAKTFLREDNYFQAVLNPQQ